MEREKLYKIDTKGKVRVWWIEYTDEAYRTHSGQLGGAIVTSGWQYTREKNVGKINATTIPEQIVAEVASRYEVRQYQGKYHPSIEEAKTVGAKFIECMLAEKFNPKKNKDYPYFSQPKLDGVRCLVSEEGMQTRNGKEFVSSPHIQEILAAFFEEYPGYILDGELYNHDLKHDFEKIISLARKTKPTEADLLESREMVQYHIYDVITPNEMNYEDRKEFLNKNVGNLYGPSIQLVPTSLVKDFEESRTKLAEYLEAGYEGQMLRTPKSIYEHRRSKNLLKDKEFEDGEYEIVDIIEGKGNWSGYAKAAIIKLEDGSTQQAGMRGNFAQAKKILEEKDQYVGTEVTVRSQNRTADGKLRFPVITFFWKGKRDL